MDNGEGDLEMNSVRAPLYVSPFDQNMECLVSLTEHIVYRCVEESTEEEWQSLMGEQCMSLPHSNCHPHNDVHSPVPVLRPPNMNLPLFCL